jgi:hypothetical protein
VDKFSIRHANLPVVFGLLALAAAIIGFASAAAYSASVPGGPAPKPLLGTWQATITRAEERRSAAPSAWPNHVLLTSHPWREVR